MSFVEQYLIPFFLSMTPIGELRAGIPAGIALGAHPVFIYIVAVLGNLLVIPIVFFFLNYFHIHFMRIRYYRAFFRRYIERNRARIEEKIGTKYEFLALMLFVGIPLPITGAYTGSVLAWFFGVEKKTAYPALIGGVFLSGLITLGVTLSAIQGYSILVN